MKKRLFKRLLAFTFAEVMISLAVIGVIAALTMPGILTDYQNKAFASGLANSIGILEKGFEKMMIDDKVSKFTRTTFYRKNTDRWQMQTDPMMESYFKSSYDPNITFEYNPFRGYVEYTGIICVGEMAEIPYDDEYIEMWPERAGQTYFGCTEYGEGTEPRYITQNPYLSGKPRVLHNGSFVWMKSLEAMRGRDYMKLSGIAAIIHIDVNGAKGPNTYGYDIQKVALQQDGRIVPLNLDTYDEYTSDGTVGAKRIRDDGWKIKY